MAEPASRLPRIGLGEQLPARDLIGARQRERILDAATALFADQGYQQTTLEQITKRAKIAWATLYQHFETKEQCFLAAFDQAVDDAARGVGEALAGKEGWADQVSAVAHALIELIEAEPSRASLVLIESQNAGREARARYEAVVERLAVGLRSGRKLDPGTTRPERLEETLIGGIAWLVQGPVAADDPQRLAALEPEIVQIALAPYLGEQEAERLALRGRP